MAKQPPKKETSASHPVPAAVDAVVESVAHNGTEIALPGSSAPSTRISLEFGIDNLVAIGIVHAENRLFPQLEQQVAENHRLGNEVTIRAAELQAIYNDTEATDLKFEEDCKTLVAAAEALGIQLALELTKSNFDPNTLKYNVNARFRGELSIVRTYVLDNDRATAIRDEIAELRVKQTEQSKAASRTKSRLSPGWLEKQLRASIAKNAMNESEAGAATVDALLRDLDKAIDGGAVPVLRQLERD